MFRNQREGNSDRKMWDLFKSYTKSISGAVLGGKPTGVNKQHEGCTNGLNMEGESGQSTRSQIPGCHAKEFGKFHQ